MLTRSAPQGSTWCTCRSAATTAAPGRTTRPTGLSLRDALDEIGYAGALTIESFTPDNASIAVAASIWRPLAATPDDLARDGLGFLRAVFTTGRMSCMPSPARPRCRRGRLLVHGQGPLQRVAQRQRVLPERSAVRQQVLVGRDDRAVKEAAARYGWAESATDWSAVVTRDDIDIVDICTPGHLHAEIALAALAGGQARAGREAAGELGRRSPRRWCGRRRPRPPPASGRWWASTTAGCRRWRWPASSSPTAGSARCAQVRAAYLQDWLADDAAPMTWRLRQETAGSGALGDLGSHVVDQVQLPARRAGRPRRAGHLRTFVDEPSGRRRPGAGDRRRRRLGDAGDRVRRGGQRRGQPDGHRPQERPHHRGLRRSRLALVRPRAAQRAARARRSRSDRRPRRVLVTEADHPYVGAWWPPGHVLGWDHTFTSQAADFLTAIDCGHGPVAVVRRRARRAAGAGRDRGECGRLGSDRRRHAGGLMGEAVHALHRPVGRPHARGGGRAAPPAGATTGWRSPSPASTSTRGGGTTTSTSRGGWRS